MFPMIIGAAVVAMLTTTSVLLTPKIPIYSVSIRYPPLLFFGETWDQLKATLYSKMQLQNKNLIPSDVHAVTFDMFFPTWGSEKLIQIAHVEDLYQQESPYIIPRQGFWKIRAKEMFKAEDSLILRIPLRGIYQVLSHIIYQVLARGGMLQVVATGTALISTPGAKFTLTFICDADLNALSSNMVGSDCKMQKLGGLWGNMTKVSNKMKKLALEMKPINGTVLGKKGSKPKETQQTVKLTETAA